MRRLTSFRTEFDDTVVKETKMIPNLEYKFEV